MAFHTLILTHIQLLENCIPEMERVYLDHTENQQEE